MSTNLKKSSATQSRKRDGPKERLKQTVKDCLERYQHWQKLYEDGGSDPVIEGYFAVFGDVYELWPGASETIQRGAFSGVVGGDVRALINHDTTLVLGRTRAGTLTQDRKSALRR